MKTMESLQCEARKLDAIDPNVMNVMTIEALQERKDKVAQLMSEYECQLERDNWIKDRDNEDHGYDLDLAA